MCTCQPSFACNQIAAQHCSAVLLRITPQTKRVCIQTLRAYLKTRPLPSECKLDATTIFMLLCSPTTDEEHLFEHHYDTVCAQIAQSHGTFVNVDDMLTSRWAYLTLTSFRHFCERLSKLSKRIFFHTTKRNMACARGAFNVYNKESMLSTIKYAGSHGISLLELGAAYATIGIDMARAIANQHIVIIAGRVYSTEVAPLAIPGALEAWTASLPAGLRPRRS